LEALEVCRELAFSYVEADTGPVAELFDYVEQDYHVINGIGDQGAIIGIPFARESEAARRYVIAFLRGVEPADERFDHEVEQQWGEWIPLKCASPDPYGWCVSVRGDKLRCSPLVEVGDDVDEIFRKAEEGKGPDQLIMVGRWECSLEV
jgi:hypothetical protein